VCSWCVRALQHYIDLHSDVDGPTSVITAVDQATGVASLSLSLNWSNELRSIINSRRAAAASAGLECALLPLSGTVPDMHASTSYFIALQKVRVK